VNVRKAVLSDAKGIAKVHVDSWRTTYPGIVSDEYLNQLSYEEREKLWNDVIPNGGLVFVAENDEGEIVGFSSGGKERSGSYPEYTGELYAIYILKEYQGMGLGRLLVKPLVEELRKQHIHSMLVLVIEGNPSQSFYEALGAKKIDSLEFEMDGQKLNELVYGWGRIDTLLSE
jgi:L-amino acid N-acyltransferase YncA